MKVPEWLPYGRQTITSEDEQMVLDCLRSDYLTQGPQVPAFENELTLKCNSTHAVAFNSATSALHAACLALGLGPGDLLWTSPISFVASANCGLYCGASIDFVDIDPDTALISLSSLEQRLQQAQANGTLPKVLVPVHLAGTSCPMAELAMLADRYGFQILEDASHAVGASYDGLPVGSCEFSAITVFSFHPVKIITTGEGGAALSRDPELVERLQRLRSHGISRDAFEQSSPGPWYYEQQELGFNYRLTDLQASLGLSQLRRLTEIVDRRQELMARYRQLVQGWPSSFLDEPANCRSSYHLAVITIPDASPNQHRALFEGMRAARIGVQLHYWPIPLQPHYRRLGFKPGDFPLAERYANTSFSLPLFPAMTEADQDRVLSCLEALLKQQGLA
ncbi:UDP-4-amino-4,6-dideoxy-N-acetyl-beta-L-altrosamine transaminase [Synechococcus sp. GEYO]|uniref:UDP-4-amino-4, 6-dideoxy-N-acetyl-beta-L-altrosamine transaminase n=1 Tax=Synechococcus sp. GEYO TaxID=2575511 RepID=UPI000E0E6613|nr:UDP-4-amino-4,6-dideoxy-N-acetyl-beta-L-altrosamine transaminase [Synechococcus sp. GEYO]